MSDRAVYAVQRVLQIGVFASVSHAYVSGQLHYVAEPLQQLAYARQRIVQDLSSRPGKHIVMIATPRDRPWNSHLSN